METESYSAPLSEFLIKEQTQKIFNDPIFSVSDILTRFLQYIVRETLAGRSNMIKEYTIGVDVLNKPPDFKPQYDAIVRIHAGRLRRALNNYYKESGTDDLIEITIPKGSYVPLFRLKDITGRDEDSCQPDPGSGPARAATRIAVIPFRCYDKDPTRLAFAECLGQQLSAEFGLFPDFSVVAYYVARQAAEKVNGVRDLGSLYGVQYVISGNLQFEKQHLRVSVQLTEMESGDQAWSDQYDYRFDAHSVFEIQDDIVNRVVSVLADFYGLIIKQAAMKSPAGRRHKGGASRAMIWYHRFAAALNSTAYMKSLLAMEQLVLEDPQYDLAWAYLGELSVQSFLFNHGLKEDSLQKAFRCAYKALQLDPYCQQAFLTLGWAHLYARNKTACLVALEHALAINPNAASIRGSAGTILICAGEYERAMDLLNQSTALNKTFPPMVSLGMSIYYLKSGDYESSLHWVSRLNNDSFAWCSIIRMAAHGLLSAGRERQAAYDGMESDIRNLSSVDRPYIAKFLLDEDLVDQLCNFLPLPQRIILTVA